MTIKWKNIAPTILVLYSLPITAWADVPLSVDEIIADKNKFVLETILHYQNTTNSAYNSDALSPVVGLRYGVNEKFDVGIKTKALYHTIRYDTNTPSTTDTRLQEFSIGTQYQVIKNDEHLPNTIAFAELSVYDNTQGLKPKSLSSALVGGTVYHSYDPIILSLTGSYLYNTDRKNHHNETFNSGDTLSVSGQANFIVNPDISLTGGVGWRLKQPNTLNNRASTRTQTRTYLDFGLLYNLSQRTGITTAIRTPVSGGEGSTITVRLTTKLGELPTPLSQKYRQKQLQELSEPTTPF